MTLPFSFRQPLLLTAFMFPIPRRQSCEGRTTPLTTAGVKATSPPPVSLTTAQPSLTLASLTLPSTLLFHPCRVRYVLPAPTPTPPPRTAAPTRSSRTRGSTSAFGRSLSVRTGPSVSLLTNSSPPLLLTLLSLSLALGSSRVPRRTPTFCLVLPSLAPTLAC